MLGVEGPRRGWSWPLGVLLGGCVSVLWCGFSVCGVFVVAGCFWFLGWWVCVVGVGGVCCALDGLGVGGASSGRGLVAAACEA
jgi:hypothetical protein